MKYGPSDQILSFVKNRFIYQKVEKLQFRIKTLRKWQTTKSHKKIMNQDLCISIHDARMFVFCIASQMSPIQEKYE